MRVCFAAGREPEYQRNRVIIRGLRELGIELDEVVSRAPRYHRRLPAVFLGLMRRRGSEPDLYFAGFLGHPIVLLLRALGRGPIAFDPFISVFDTLCGDRERFRPGSLAGRLSFKVDKLACDAADLIFLDTDAHIEYFASTFSQPREKFRRLWVGADDRLYSPRPGERRDAGGTVEVFYYSTFQPLHGVDVVLGAAELLGDNRNVHFDIVGRGPELKGLEERLARGEREGALSWRPWVPEDELPRYIARADICLGGHFSTRPKASRVIPGKTYQFMAMRKALVAGDNSANRELLTHGEDALFVEMGDPEALAAAVLQLAEDADLRERIAANAYRVYLETCTPEALSGCLGEALESLLASG